MSFQVGRGPARPAMELLLLVLTVRVFIVTSWISCVRSVRHLRCCIAPGFPFSRCRTIAKDSLRIVRRTAQELISKFDTMQSKAIILLLQCETQTLAMNINRLYCCQRKPV